MKIQNVIDNDMIPIYCINETLEEMNDDKELKNIENQLEAIPNYVKYIIVAFEPIWLINNPQEQIDIEHLNKVFEKIKTWLMERNINHAIIYGGGINKENLNELKNINCIDGFIMSTSELDGNSLEYIYNNIN